MELAPLPSSDNSENDILTACEQSILSSLQVTPSQVFWEQWCHQDGRFTFLHVDGDGNCLPSSLFKGVSKPLENVTSALELRKHICSGVRGMNIDRFKSLLEVDMTYSREEWVEIFSPDKSYCDLSFIRIFCAMFKKCVHVVISLSRSSNMIELYIDSNGQKHACILDIPIDVHLAFYVAEKVHSSGHYDVLLPIIESY